MRDATIEKYLKYVTEVEKLADTRTLYHVGENFFVEVLTCPHDLDYPGDLMNLWVKYGYIQEPLKTHIAVSTYYFIDDKCVEKYNITIKRASNRPGYVLNFDYLREATPENEKELVAECIRLAVKDKACFYTH